LRVIIIAGGRNHPAELVFPISYDPAH
jgi:hypothetical protein